MVGPVCTITNWPEREKLDGGDQAGPGVGSAGAAAGVDAASAGSIADGAGVVAAGVAAAESAPAGAGEPAEPVAPSLTLSFGFAAPIAGNARPPPKLVGSAALVSVFLGW